MNLLHQVGVSEAPVGCRSDNILQSVDKPMVLYKPIAKLAPRKSTPLLENKVSFLLYVADYVAHSLKMLMSAWRILQK